MTQAHGTRPSSVDELETLVFRRVSACWPRTWRQTYGEEMALNWGDAGADRKELGIRAQQGLRHRVMRPVAAASLDTTHARPCHDVAVIDHPRYLFRFLVAIAAALAILTVEVVLGFALGDTTGASAGYSEASMRNAEIRVAEAMSLLVAPAVAMTMTS